MNKPVQRKRRKSDVRSAKTLLNELLKEFQEVMVNYLSLRFNLKYFYD